MGFNNKILGYIELTWVIIFIIFWIYFFIVENKDKSKSKVYLAYERSFPFVDLGWIVPCLLLGGYGLLKSISYGPIFSIIAGSSMIFLSIHDITFYLQQKIYSGIIDIMWLGHILMLISGGLLVKILF